MPKKMLVADLLCGAGGSSTADAHFNLKPFVKAKGSNKRTIVEKARRKGKEISVERREMA